MTRRAWILALLAVLVLAAPAAAAIPPGNLIQNPGGEDQGPPPPHWTGTMNVVTYGLGDYPSRLVGDPFTGGCAFFTGGSTPTATGQQTIPLTGIPEIATGNVVGTLSGYLGGFLTQEDNAKAQVSFTHAGTPVGTSLVVGPVTAAERNQQTSLLHRVATGQIPPTADLATVILTFTRAEGNADDGYADNLSFTLDGSEAPPPATTCLPDLDSDGYSTAVDCNDANALVHPGAAEVPDDGIDQDCSGADSVNLDRDGDGYNRPQDCNDQNPAIHPGAVDTPGDGIDQDCNLADAKFPHVTAVVGMSWSKSDRGTRVDSLKITKVPAGATVRVTCKGKRCAFSRKSVKLKKRAANAGSLFKGRFLGKGAVVDVVVSQAGAVGQVARYKIQKPHKNPVRSDLCTLPGSATPRTCAGL